MKAIVDLKKGQTAPAFKTFDVFGKPVDTQTIKARYTLLAFMRYSGCPWCNLAVHRLTMEYPLLKKQNCDVIVVIQSTKENIIDNIYKRHAIRPPFKIIADPEGALYEKYHVRASVKAIAHSFTKLPYWVHAVKEHGFKQKTVDGNLFTVPAWFLITNKGKKIMRAHYGSSYYEHETFTELYEALFAGE